MLSKETVQKMTDYFFGGEPEKAYELVSSMAEWGQFEVSTSDLCDEQLAYVLCAVAIYLYGESMFRPLSAQTPQRIEAR